MGISPDRFVPKQDGSPQSLSGLHKAGQGLGGGLLSGFTGLVSGIGQALGSLFTGGLGKDHAFYPVYIGLRDSVQPLIEKNTELSERVDAAIEAAGNAALKAGRATTRLNTLENTVSRANTNAEQAIANASTIANTLDQTKKDFATKLSLANTKAIEALGKADKAFESALKATNDAVRTHNEFIQLQNEVNSAQRKLNEGFQAVDTAFEKTRVRMLVIPDDTPESSVTLPGYITVYGRGGRTWGGKSITIAPTGRWSGHVAGVIKARNGAMDVCSLSVRNGQIVEGSSRGRMGEGSGVFIAGGSQVYVGCLLFVIPEDTK